MVIVHLGHVPFARHHHVGLLEAYARRARVIYLEMGGRRAADRSSAATPDLDRHRAAVDVRGGVEIRRFAPLIPGSRLAPIARWNWWLAARATLADLRRIGVRDRVLITQTPGLLPTFAGLGADLTAYLIIDDYVGLAAARNRAAVARAHRRMVRGAGLVWAISEPLLEEARGHRSAVHLTTTGVDHAAFAAAAAAPPPESMAALPAPRIGMVGNLNERIDWPLAEGLARARPSWSLVFVGPLYHADRATHEAVTRLRVLPNVHFLPEVAPEDLPRAIAGLDVGLVLYRPGTGTMGINPLKLYQYLAGGKPVVATPLPVFDAFRDLVHVADSSTAFAEAIAVELGATDVAHRAEERRRRARAFDWDQVAADRMALLGVLLRA